MPGQLADRLKSVSWLLIVGWLVGCLLACGDGVVYVDSVGDLVLMKDTTGHRWVSAAVRGHSPAKIKSGLKQAAVAVGYSIDAWPIGFSLASAVGIRRMCGTGAAMGLPRASKSQYLGTLVTIALPGTTLLGPPARRRGPAVSGARFNSGLRRGRP